MPSRPDPNAGIPEWLRIRRSVTWGIPDAWDRFTMLWFEVAWGMFLRAAWTAPVANIARDPDADRRV